MASLNIKDGNLARDMEWKSFTPTGVWTTNTTYTGVYRVVGDTLQVRMGVSLTGAPTGNGNFNLPSGFQINSSKIVPYGRHTVGYCKAIQSGVNWYWFDIVASATASLTTVYAIQKAVAGSLVAIPATGVNATNPWVWGNNDEMNIYYSVPII